MLQHYYVNMTFNRDDKLLILKLTVFNTRKLMLEFSVRLKCRFNNLLKKLGDTTMVDAHRFLRSQR